MKDYKFAAGMFFLGMGGAFLLVAVAEMVNGHSITQWVLYSMACISVGGFIGKVK